MKFEFSAGGIVYTFQNKKRMILLAQHSQHHGWGFPKGLIGDSVENETKEATALREVEEETGAIAEILEPVTPVSYWYVWQEEKRKKTVYYFIMKYLEGDITKHDFEMEAVEWFDEDKVENQLTYKADKDAWKEARAKLPKE